MVISGILEYKSLGEALNNDTIGSGVEMNTDR